MTKLYACVLPSLRLFINKPAMSGLALFKDVIPSLVVKYNRLKWVFYLSVFFVSFNAQAQLAVWNPPPWSGIAAKPLADLL